MKKVYSKFQGHELFSIFSVVSLDDDDEYVFLSTCSLLIYSYHSASLIFASTFKNFIHCPAAKRSRMLTSNNSNCCEC